MTLAILRALAAAVRRDLAGFGPVRTNNFFLFIVLLVWGAAVSGVAPLSAYPFLALLALLLFFPISSDPLEKIPPVRLLIWPLPAETRVALRLAALALSPVLWFVVLFLIREGKSFVLPLGAVLGAAILRAQVSGGGRRIEVARSIPGFRAGMALLISCELRGMLSVLDTWLGLCIAVIGTGWKLFDPAPDPMAGRVLAMLTGIAISTQAQSGLRLRETRYQLLPMPAWRAVLARDAAYMTMQIALSAAFDPVAGAAFGMASLAFGRYPALYANLRLERWRFAGGRVLFGVLQMVAGAILAFDGARGLAVAFVIWTMSVWWAGRQLSRQIFPGR